MKVVNATMMPSLLYTCESWSLTKQQKSKVQATQMNVLRRIQGVSRIKRIMSDESSEVKSALDVIKRRQEQLEGQVE